MNVRVTSAPTLPRSSVPTTWKRCTPSARPMIVTESGQGPNGSSSIRHAHVPGSSAVRRTATGARTIPPSRGSATVTTGPVVSTVNVRRATGVTSPPKSRARTSKVCVPSGRPAYVTGDVQTSNGRPSRRQENCTPSAPGPENANRAVRSVLRPVRAASICTASRWPAVRKDTGADAGETLPARSTVSMRSVWSATPVNVRVRPGSQAANAVSASKRQRNVARSSPVKANHGDDPTSGAASGLVMTGWAGATVSTVNLWISTRPTASPSLARSVFQDVVAVRRAAWPG